MKARLQSAYFIGLFKSIEIIIKSRTINNGSIVVTKLESLLTKKENLTIKKKKFSLINLKIKDLITIKFIQYKIIQFFLFYKLKILLR